MTGRDIPKEMPPGLVYYNRTPVFTRENVPQALLSAHSVRADVYGLIRVLSGRLLYCLESAEGSVTAGAGEDVVIEPAIRHRVALLDEDTAFRVEFYRDARIPVRADAQGS